MSQVHSVSSVASSAAFHSKRIWSSIMRALILLCLCLAASALANDQSTNRSKRQMFSSSGLVFPGPPRRRGPQPSSPQQIAQPKTNPDEGSEIPAELPAPRPYTRRTEVRDNPEPSATPVRPQERASVDRQVPPLPPSVIAEEAKPSLPVPQAQYRPRQPVHIEEEEEEEEEASSEVYGNGPRSSSVEPTKWQDYERPPQYQPKRPVTKPPVRRPNYPEGYRPIQPQSVRGNNVESDRSRRPPERDYEEERVKDIEEDYSNEEEEEHKPDKLQLMLMKSEFTCSGRKNGYYADEGLECEIFHYCADGVMHSWLCPEGASFHQVHLICMPANKENICKKSSQFHFVNDYLYQPIDDDGNSDNSSSIYADRYYPDGYEHGAPFDMAKVNEPDEARFQAFNRREDGYNNQEPPQRVQPPQQRPLRRRPAATDPRYRLHNNNNRRNGGVSERPSSLARPYQSPRISEDELASHNLDAKDEDGYQIRRRLTRPVRPAYDQETDQEDDE